MTLVSTNSTTENQESVSVAKQQSNDEVNTTLLDVSTTLSHDLSSFPRELTVKEVSNYCFFSSYFTAKKNCLLFF